MVQPEKNKTVDEQLEVIVEHLERIDRRDRLRTWGGFVRSILGLIPLAISLFFLWYVYTHGQDLLQQIFDQAGKQAATMGSSSVMKQLQQYMQQK